MIKVRVLRPSESVQSQKSHHNTRQLCPQNESLATMQLGELFLEEVGPDNPRWWVVLS